jgi:hypothetical protein
MTSGGQPVLGPDGELIATPTDEMDDDDCSDSRSTGSGPILRHSGADCPSYAVNGTTEFMNHNMSAVEAALLHRAMQASCAMTSTSSSLQVANESVAAIRPEMVQSNYVSTGNGIGAPDSACPSWQRSPPSPTLQHQAMFGRLAHFYPHQSATAAMLHTGTLAGGSQLSM